MAWTRSVGDRPEMDAREITQREFTLQADQLERAATFTSTALRDRLRDALGPEHRGGRILDLACGPGLVCEALAAEARQVVGVDLTREMIERARRRCEEAGLANTEFREGPVESLPFESGSFDAVVSRLAVHHFRDPLAPLREAHRVLRPGGRLVVLDIVCSEDAPCATLHNALETLRDPSHARLLPESELLDTVRKAGFTVGDVQAWEQPRTFSEWASIVEDARSLDALEPVMRSLADAGLDAGVSLSCASGEVTFVHHWRSVAADRA